MSSGPAASRAKRGQKAYRDGLMFETMSELYLRAKGYQILARRYKTPYGEIDIIARDGDFVVFVEVKGRINAEDALYAVTPKTQARIGNAAAHYIQARADLSEKPMRFDVIAISLPFSVRHIDNAWFLAA